MSKFNEIIGHDKIKEYFINSINTRAYNAYLLCGEKGCGKMLLAKTFAEGLLCETKNDKPCGLCDSCIKAEALSHPDVIYVTHEKKGSISVDEIREQVVVPMSIKPYYGKFKIFIIDDSEMMTVQSQNALLKTLEEPPEYGIVMLLSSNEELLLSTILSRVVKLHCGEIQQSLIEKYLNDKYSISDNDAAMCSVFAQGNIGRAIEMGTSEDFNASRQASVTLAKEIPDTTNDELISRVKELSSYKERMNIYFDFLYVWYHDILIYKATKSFDGVLFVDEISAIKEQASRCSYEGIEKTLEALNTAKLRLRENVNFDLTMELLLITIKESYL